MTVTASLVITKQGMILIFCFERFAVQKFIDNDIEFVDNFLIGKFTIIFLNFVVYSNRYFIPPDFFLLPATKQTEPCIRFLFHRV